MSEQKDRIDVQQLLASVDLVEIVRRQVDLKKSGRSHMGRCPFHDDSSPSFDVSESKQLYVCHGCGAGGTAIDFVMRTQGIGFLDACKMLGAGDLGPHTPRLPRPPPPPERVTAKPPVGSEPRTFDSPKFGHAVAVWCYRDAAGDVLGYVARYEYEEDGRAHKITPQWTYGTTDGGKRWWWGMGHWNSPRPLYGLDALEKFPDRQVLIVEGEKAKDAAQRLIGDSPLIAITWPGGCNATSMADWAPLKGRDIIFWRDADKAGAAARDAITLQLRPLAQRIRWLEPEAERESGWDAADLEDEGCSDFLTWAKSRIVATPAVIAVPAAPPPPAAPPDPEQDADAFVEVTPLADHTLAEAFTRAHPDLRYVHTWGRWLEWKPSICRWEEDKTLRVYDYARRVCVREANRFLATGARGIEPAVKKAKSTQTRSAVESMAKADPVHASCADDWDADNWLLNTPGGVVDLRTGIIRDGQLEDYLTKTTAVAPAGECPTWLRFIEQATAGDAELAGFLQRVAGYCLTGDVRDHAMFFAYGTGGNGKGTFLNTLAYVMGDYAKNSPSEAFMGSSGDRHPQELASLRGRRMVTVQEVQDGHKWNEQRIKALTGGDKVTARFMRQDEFEFNPTFKLIFSGNHKPGLVNVDEAIRRRLYLIPFTVTVSAEQRDVRLSEKLRAESGGILQWCIAGCRAWDQNGLGAPESVRIATKDYLDSQDLIAQWIEDRCEIGRFYQATVGALFTSYKAWMEAANVRPDTRNRMTEALQSRGFTKEHNGKNYVHIGLRLPVSDTPTDRRTAERDDPYEN